MTIAQDVLSFCVAAVIVGAVVVVVAQIVGAIVLAVVAPVLAFLWDLVRGKRAA